MIGRACTEFHISPDQYFDTTDERRSFMRGWVAAKDAAEAKARKDAERRQAKGGRR